MEGGNMFLQHFTHDGEHKRIKTVSEYIRVQIVVNPEHLVYAKSPLALL